MLGEKKPGFVFANTHHIRERSVEVREFGLECRVVLLSKLKQLRAACRRRRKKGGGGGYLNSNDSLGAHACILSNNTCYMIIVLKHDEARR